MPCASSTTSTAPYRRATSASSASGARSPSTENTASATTTARASSAFGEHRGHRLDLAVRRDGDPGARQTARVHDRGVVQRVGDHQVTRTGQGGDRAEVGQVAGGEDQPRLGTGEVRQLGLQLGVQLGGTGHQSGTGRSRAPGLRRGRGRGYYLRVARQTQVVVARQVEQAVPAGRPGTEPAAQAGRLAAVGPFVQRDAKASGSRRPGTPSRQSTGLRSRSRPARPDESLSAHDVIGRAPDRWRQRSFRQPRRSLSFNTLPCSPWRSICGLLPASRSPVCPAAYIGSTREGPGTRMRIRYAPVPSLRDLVRRFADLDEQDLEWLHVLVSDWQLLADLSFADLVLWVPGPGRSPARRGGPDAPDHRTHRLPRRPGRDRSSPRGDRPLLDAALTERRIVRDGDPEWREGVPVRRRPSRYAVATGSSR